ncbi:MAG: ribonuclease [Candidatus Accumulibacter sp.]|uniref:ribonuclease domain-containing protein n=1 Tax=Accumulibacter sp. TaxID=2053492 RepID=UPI0019D8A1C8|nr:ribonuclease domain-containing protein [Accumulibacter sp.]MBE2258632.1 ribonuclease [Paracoccaceae bacterium]MCB1943345.1 ribonuclease [Accumulibacter sp.]MCP5246992.1 ribonuclease [Accumulibacter sp.]
MSPLAGLFRRLALAALVACLGWSGLLALGGAGSQAREVQSLPTVTLAELPAEVAQVLRLIRQGGPFPYPHKDGSIFGNFERRLPVRTRGYYREYTVPTPGSRDRGARRIIAGQGSGGDVARSGEYYYTADHYRSFRRIRE